MSNDFRSELEMWCDLWDDAQAQGVHPQPPKPKPVRSTDEFAGGNTAQDYYFGFLDETEDEVLQEEKIPNPIYPDTVGPDSTTTPPAWVNEDLLKEVEGLKNKLFAVENKLAKMGNGKKWTEKAIVQTNDQKLMSEIESLRKRIERVSSQLGVEHEASPWEIKRS